MMLISGVLILRCGSSKVTHSHRTGPIYQRSQQMVSMVAVADSPSSFDIAQVLHDRHGKAARGRSSR